MKIVTICLMLVLLNCYSSAKKIKPPIPKELKEACKDKGGGKRACLDEKLKEYCQDETNTDTISCKIVRLKTLIPKPVAGRVLYLVKVTNLTQIFKFVLKFSKIKLRLLDF